MLSTRTFLTALVAGMTFLSLSAVAQNTFPASGDVGIGTTTPTQGTLQIAAPDQSIESAIAIRQSNSVEYGFDFALDQYVNGMGYLYGISGNGRTALEQFDRINNFVGVGITAPQAKFQVSDMAKDYNTVNNEYDSNVEIQGLFSGKAIGQGPSFGFVDPSTGRGAASATIR